MSVRTFSDPNLVAAILASTSSSLDEVQPPGPDGRVTFTLEVDDLPADQVVKAFHAGTLEINLARYIDQRRRVTTLMKQAHDGGVMRRMWRPELPHETREFKATRGAR